MSQIKDNFLPMPARYDEETQDLLADVYLLMNFYLSGGGNLEINRSITRTVQALKDRYRLTKNDILHQIYTEFIAREHYRKIDPSKPTRTTFTAHYTNYMLKSLLRNYGRGKEIPHSATVSWEEICEQQKSDDRDRRGYSFDYWEKRGFPGLSNPITPEDEYLGMELQGIIDDHFGEFDGQVAAGYLDRQDAADLLNIRYNTYCKRFRRKIDDFMPVLSGTGYLC
jgi:hypothetical protein